MQKQDELGVQFGKYQIFAKLAVGGMAELYLAKQPGIGGFSKTVVLKCILPHLANDDEFITMFLDEARVVAPLDHPNIIHIYEIGEATGMYYIVMEYIRGQNLKVFRKRLYRQHSRVNPYLIAAGIVSQVAGGLYYAHTAIDDDGQPLELVHRDISPTNLIVGYNGTVKVVDFGVAKATNQQHHTTAGTIKGKYRYMSPEQIRGHELDARSDLFSLGIVLYELSANRGLFARRSEMEVIDAVREVRVIPPTKFRKDYPPELERIVLKALSRDPARRYQSGDEFRLDLELFMRNMGGHLGQAQIAEVMQELFSEEKTGERSGVLHTPLAPHELARFIGTAHGTGQFAAHGTGARHAVSSSGSSFPTAAPGAGSPFDPGAMSGSGHFAASASGMYSANQHNEGPTRPHLPDGSGSFSQASQASQDAALLNQLQGGQEHEMTIPAAAILGHEQSPHQSNALLPPQTSGPHTAKPSSSGRLFLVLFLLLLLGGGGAAYYFVFVRGGQQKTFKPVAEKKRILGLVNTKQYVKAEAALRIFRKHAGELYPEWVTRTQELISIGPQFDFARQKFANKQYKDSIPLFESLRKKAPDIQEIEDYLARAKRALEANKPPERRGETPETPPVDRRKAPTVRRTVRRRYRTRRRWTRRRKVVTRPPVRRKDIVERVEPPAPREIPKGSLYVSATPSGRVELNGKLLGFTPINNRKVKVGAYTVRITRKGHKTITKRIQIREGRPTELDLELISLRAVVRRAVVVRRVAPPPRRDSRPKAAMKFSAIRLPRQKTLRLFIGDRRGIAGRHYTLQHRKLCKSIEREVRRVMGSSFAVRGVTRPWQRLVLDMSRRQSRETKVFYPRAVAYVIYRNLLKGRSKKRVAQLLVSYEYRKRFKRYRNK